MERQKSRIRPCGRATWLCAFLALAAALFATPCTSAVSIEHDIAVELLPEEATLIGTDTMTLMPEDADSLEFRLSPKATSVSVTVAGKKRGFDFSGGTLRIFLNPEESRSSVNVVVRYQAVFEDAAPLHPVNTDNPGFGVVGAISKIGTFLLNGSGWYPELIEPSPGHPVYKLSVTAPAGVVAVTAGRRTGLETLNGKTVSKWRVDYPLDGLTLSAGRYEIQERNVGGITAATYFFPENTDLSDRYLDAVEHYLKLYTDLFGPYPFEKFAVVENFFPTGYGFPSYTLIGGRVLRLPFIVGTSLGHEIAHCWWGNGVYVDYESGNWSEGLTTYVADYLYKEMISAEAARDYRLQMLRNYATLVSPKQEFPLSAFTSRTDPATKAVGYDKCAMVFHMLRIRVGDENFWASLKRIYKDRLFSRTGWADFQKEFEARSGLSLDDFFRQWIHQKGAPVLHLEDVKKSDDDKRISGRIVQEQDPTFDFALTARLETTAGVFDRTVHVKNAVDTFTLPSKGAPSRLSLDPEIDLFRRLHASEMPPSINSLKGADRVLVVMTENSAGTEQAVRILLKGLGIGNPRFIPEAELDAGQSTGHDLLIVGRPANDRLLANASRHFAFSAKNGFTIDEKYFSGDGITFFGVFEHPGQTDLTAALFLPADADSRLSETVAMKIPHYGKYSYLVFEKEENLVKGIWPVRNSPIVHRWTTTEEKTN